MKCMEIKMETYFSMKYLLPVVYKGEIVKYNTDLLSKSYGSTVFYLRLIHQNKDCGCQSD